MIEALVMLNELGKVCLRLFYAGGYDTYAQSQLTQDVYRLLRNRPCNACEVLHDEEEGLAAFGKGRRVIYRKYANLLVFAVIDAMESELATVDLIHTIVATLDSALVGGSDIDMLRNFDNLLYIVNEAIQGGLALEVDQRRLTDIVRSLNLTSP